MTKRFFSGSKPGGGQMGEAARMKRIELEKGGKLPFTPQERYRRIMKKKMEENQSSLNKTSSFQMPGAQAVNKKPSKKTQEAMRMIAQRKALKEEKELRKMVVVKPMQLGAAGRIDKKGFAYDAGNNRTLKVDMKTGTIKTMSGWTVGKYNSKRMFGTKAVMQDALQKHGAFFIQQKKLKMLEDAERAQQAMNSGTVWSPGGGSGGLASQMFMEEHEHSRMQQQNANPRSNVTAWGGMSTNVLGTHSDNVWGGMVDNVWGGTDSNIWGGLGGSAWGNGDSGWTSRRISSLFRGGTGGGGGTAWGSGRINFANRGLSIFGSGKDGQKNFLKPVGALLSRAFGNSRIARAFASARSGRAR